MLRGQGLQTLLHIFLPVVGPSGSGPLQEQLSHKDESHHEPAARSRLSAILRPGDTQRVAARSVHGGDGGDPGEIPLIHVAESKPSDECHMVEGTCELAEHSGK